MRTWGRGSWEQGATTPSLSAHGPVAPSCEEARVGGDRLSTPVPPASGRPWQCKGRRGSQLGQASGVCERGVLLGRR